MGNQGIEDMARDIRVPKAGENRCLYYDAKYINNMKLEPDTIAKGVFYAGVSEPFTKSVEGNTTITRRTSKKGKIFTNDYIPDLMVNSYVLFKGSLYIVDEIVETEKTVKSAYGNRKIKTTYIGVRQ